MFLKEYLNKVIFFRKRKFNKPDVIEYMYSLSHPYNSTIKWLNKLFLNKKYHLATINNESLELNQHRINKFKLKKYFINFFSSCYVGTRKPELKIFIKALHILQRNPEECLFIDDKEKKYQSAKGLGINLIHLKNPAELKKTK